MGATTTKTDRPRTNWRRFIVVIAVTYGGICLVLIFLENLLLFHPTSAASDWRQPPTDPAPEDVWLHTADGTLVHAWYFRSPTAEGALLYCHGNAGNLSHRGSAAVDLMTTLNLSVLVFDYPGFGRSEGAPSEASCYAAGLAAYDWLTEQVRGDKIVLYGNSLGGGIATELALTKPHRTLVLAKTFTSIPDMAQSKFPFLPARYLVRSRFDNLAKIAQCPRPVFVIHGDQDTLIPFSQGERLFAAALEPKGFFPIPGGGHNDEFPADCRASLAAFLHKIAAPAMAVAPD